MQIQINTDHNVDGKEALAAYVRGEIKQVLSRFSDRITRVEIHLSDENSDKKGGKDCLKCVLEARLEGHKPLAVTDQSTTLELAVHGALDKLIRLIDSTVGRLKDQRYRKAEPSSSGLDDPDKDEE